MFYKLGDIPVCLVCQPRLSLQPRFPPLFITGGNCVDFSSYNNVPTLFQPAAPPLFTFRDSLLIFYEQNANVHYSDRCIR